MQAFERDGCGIKLYSKEEALGKQLPVTHRRGVVVFDPITDKPYLRDVTAEDYRAASKQRSAIMTFVRSGKLPPLTKPEYPWGRSMSPTRSTLSDEEAKRTVFPPLSTLGVGPVGMFKPHPVDKLVEDAAGKYLRAMGEKEKDEDGDRVVWSCGCEVTGDGKFEWLTIERHRVFQYQHQQHVWAPYPKHKRAFEGVEEK